MPPVAFEIEKIVRFRETEHGHIRYEQLLPQLGELSTFEYRYNVILSASRAEKFANARNGKRVLKACVRNRADMKKRESIARLIYTATYKRCDYEI